MQTVRTVLTLIMFLLLAVDVDADMYQNIAKDGSMLFSNLPSSGAKVIVREKRASHKGAIRTTKNRNVCSGNYNDIAEAKAKKHNVDPKLVKAVIKAESNWNPSAVSNKGAVGMMQLMPKTANDMGVCNPLDAEENIEGGTKYLRYLLDKFNGNMALALAAYNAGPARVEKTGGVPSIPETMDYVKRVMSDYSGGNYVYAGRITRIRTLVLKDGSMLYTNAFNSSRSYSTN
ncbi:MAG TPA: lytic transglycosylase domain-containing protein [Dissulfurispiraceae bacterium]|nr:lytic transglycosylase domain-containing protein [Dissulfurispiraceae bacterium]